MEESRNTLKSAERRKRRIRSFMTWSVASLGAFCLLGLLGFANHSRSNTRCWSLEIDAPVKGMAFLDEEAIRNLAIGATDSIIGCEISRVDINAIHRVLMQNPSIREAHVYTTVDGRCKIRVEQRMPVARVINEDGSSLYLDDEGYTMPVSRSYTVRVPVFTGSLREKVTTLPVSALTQQEGWTKTSYLDDILVFTRFIRENEFMSAQVEHVNILSNGDFEIIPRVGNHRIVIGPVADLDRKFRQLMAFYAHTLNTRDLNSYRKIVLKYNNQVVCEK